MRDPSPPPPLFGCCLQACAESVSYPPDMLVWIEPPAWTGWESGWYCEYCTEEIPQDWDGDKGGHAPLQLGPRLDQVLPPRLIAAAPDLLETLADLVNAADERFPGNDPHRPIIEQARAVIAMASSEEEAP